MAYQVVWTQKARQQRKDVLIYGKLAFGEVTSRIFRDILHENCILLANNPNLGKQEPLLQKYTLAFRSLVVHHHYKLVYYINIKQETIYIAALWDTRREPQSLAENIQKK